MMKLEDIKQGEHYRYFEEWGRVNIVVVDNIRPDGWFETTIYEWFSDYPIDHKFNEKAMLAFFKEHDLRPVSETPELSRQRVFRAYSDASHGWIKVLQNDLIALGISGKISGFSHVYGKWAYLEEDDDAPKYFKAWIDATGKKPEFRANFSNRSYVRWYLPYHNPEVEVPGIYTKTFLCESGVEQ